ncbi:MAG: RNA polymerase sigma factor [Gammaproteobacteria bacterium]|nr:MAG: RNA polymerase sigma factor [Gammaproteobacteria bacterium]
MVMETSRHSLEEFLREVERRAYRSAILSTKKSADALDIVQDSMLQLVQYYGHKSASEWPLLFQRILQHRIMDWHRQQSRHKKWFWKKAINESEDEDDELNNIVDEREQDPAELLVRASDIQCVLSALEKLSLRQRQVFLLRAWEGFNVQETAETMGCSEGSVKTHYFRALQSIREYLIENA